MNTTDLGDRFISLKETIHKCGLGRSTVLRMVAAGQFPKPKKLTTRAIAFRFSEVEQWMDSRPEVA